MGRAYWRQPEQGSPLATPPFRPKMPSPRLQLRERSAHQICIHHRHAHPGAQGQRLEAVATANLPSQQSRQPLLPPGAGGVGGGSGVVGCQRRCVCMCVSVYMCVCVCV